MTNDVFLMTVSDSLKQYIVRVYGDNDLFDRETDIAAALHLSSKGLGPKIYCPYGNGRIEEFYDGDVMFGLDIHKDEEAYRSIAIKLIKFHDVTINKSDNTTPKLSMKSVTCIESLERYLRTINKDPLLSEILRSEYPEIEKKIKQSIKMFNNLITDDDLTNCHNDVHHGNMIRRGDGTISFIDFEYFGVNPLYYDIANYFNELCSFDCLISRYPDKETRKRFYEYYFGKKIESSELDHIDRKVKACSDINHLVWGLWDSGSNKFTDRFRL